MTYFSVRKIACVAGAGGLLSLAALGAGMGPAAAEIYLDKAETIGIYGDFRHRFEADYDSQNAAGLGRNDRDRLRIRARLGVKY